MERNLAAYTHTQDTHKTHTQTHKSTRLVLGLGFHAAGVLHSGRWCAVFHLHDNMKLKGQKDAFKTADHFQLQTIIPKSNDGIIRVCDVCHRLRFLSIEITNGEFHLILFINPLKGRQISLQQHNLLGEGSN